MIVRIHHATFSIKDLHIVAELVRYIGQKAGFNIAPSKPLLIEFKKAEQIKLDERTSNFNVTMTKHHYRYSTTYSVTLHKAILNAWEVKNPSKDDVIAEVAFKPVDSILVIKPLKIISKS